MTKKISELVLNATPSGTMHVETSDAVTSTKSPISFFLDKSNHTGATLITDITAFTKAELATQTTDGSQAYTSDDLSVFAATSSAQLATLLSDKTGTGLTVFGTSPGLVTPNLGTPSAGTLTSCTGLPIDAGTINTLPVLRGGTGVTTSTGTGSTVLSISPTFTGDATVHNVVHTISATTTSIDFTDEQLQTISLSGDTTFAATTGSATGISKTIKILCDGTLRTLAFPAGWKFVGAKPVDIAIAKTAILTLTCFAAGDANIVAGYAVEE